MTEQPPTGGPRRRRSARREAGPPAPPSVPPAPPPVTPAPAAGPVEERPTRLRKRPRRRAVASPMPVAPPTAAESAPAPLSAGSPPGGRERRVDHAERALRGLVTTRGTQVPWSAATRARVVAAPTAADLAEAEAELVVVRRNYTPPEPLRPARSAEAPRTRRRGD